MQAQALTEEKTELGDIAEQTLASGAEISSVLEKKTEIMDGKKIVRLAEQRKKGILRLVFSRIGLIGMLIVLQILILLSFYKWFSDYVPNYGVIRAIFVLIMVIYLFSSEMESSGKLTWMVIISVVPVGGALFYAYTQMEWGSRTIKNKLSFLNDLNRETLTQDQAVLRELEDDNSGTDDLWKYVNRTGNFPIYNNSEVTFFPMGEDKFEAMLAELEKAEKYIFLEYFIIEEGYMWGRVLEILTRKAKEGLDVRVMYDGMCEISTLPDTYPKLMSEVGIKCKPFSRIHPIISTYYNYRDHRKILVIDGKVAFTGGVNLADEYINRKERFGHWKDTAIMVKGQAAESFQLMFLEMWSVTVLSLKMIGKDIGSFYKNKTAPAPGTGSYVMPYCDSPLDGYKVGETVYIDILNRATDYVYIMTPYLILDDELKYAIIYAAQRGIDVRLILPGIPDKKMAYALAKSHYKTLLKAGVKIYEYTPGFVHAKICICDDIKAVVGTINFDYRSLYHHFECAAYLYKQPCIADIFEDYMATQEKCKKVTRETIKNEKISYKVMGSVMKFVAPLM